MLLKILSMTVKILVIAQLKAIGATLLRLRRIPGFIPVVTVAQIVKPKVAVVLFGDMIAITPARCIL